MLPDHQIKPRSKFTKRMSKAQNKRFLRRAKRYSIPANIPTNRHPAKPVAVSADLPKALYGNKPERKLSCSHGY